MILGRGVVCDRYRQGSEGERKRKVDRALEGLRFTEMCLCSSALLSVERWSLREWLRSPVSLNCLLKKLVSVLPIQEIWGILPTTLVSKFMP